jgi:chromosome partitioning protein
VRVVVTSLKGGVGKTTASVYLAAVAARGKRAVRLIDSDPQGSAAAWLEDSPIDGVEVVEAPSERLVARAMAVGDDDVAIVDTPPGSERLASVAVKLAEAVIVPTRVGGVEPARVLATLSLIPESTARGIVISSARPYTRDFREAVEYWTNEGVQIWGVIPERVGIAAGPGSALHPDGLEAAAALWRKASRAGKRSSAIIISAPEASKSTWSKIFGT